MANQRDQLRPESGFNVVSIDDYNFPPDVAVESHFDNLDEAKAAMDKLHCKAVIYDHKGKAVASK